MSRRTSHCVCSPKPNNFQCSDINSFRSNNLTNEKYMCSPPLPPRSSKNVSPCRIKKPADVPLERIGVTYSRPRSCPTEESSFLTPPVPPKYNIGDSFVAHKSHNQNFLDEKLKCDESKLKTNTKVRSRKHSRHKSADRKSRSKSRSLVKDERICVQAATEQVINNQYIDERQQNIDHFLKNPDNLINQNCQHFHDVCALCEKKAEKLKFNPNLEYDTKHHQQIHPPDVVPNRTGSIRDSTSPAFGGGITHSSKNQKLGSKFRIKFAQIASFLTKSSSSKTKTNSSTNETMIGIGGCSNSHAATNNKTVDSLTRPRRSKSLHMISRLSPNNNNNNTNSMQQENILINTSSNDFDCNTTNIFAVISPTTTRLKRNFLCISPKPSGSNKNQQRTLAASSVSGGGRISPVHLIPSIPENGGGKERLTDPSPSTATATGTSGKTINATPLGSSAIRGGHKASFNCDERKQCAGETELFKNVPGSKVRSHVNQDVKSPLSNNLGCQFFVQNGCHVYPAIENPCLAYPRFHQNVMHCSFYNTDCNHDLSSATCPQIQSCSCIHFNPSNHIHCFHPPNNTALLCGGCRVPLICPSCSYHMHYSHFKPYAEKQPFIHHSASPPSFFQRQLPPPPLPQNIRHPSRRSRKSYSKTPPPSFQTNSIPCHEDHCYQDYNFHIKSDIRQKSILSHQRKSNTYHSTSCQNTCCYGHHRCLNHSKCSGCGSLVYDELGTMSNHYNFSGCSNIPCKNQFSNTPGADSLVEVKWQIRHTDQELNNPHHCCIHSMHRHSETCGHYSADIKMCCRNSMQRSLIQNHPVVDKEKLSKRRKNSHVSNLDGETDDKMQQLESNRSLMASLNNNILSTTSNALQSDLINFELPSSSSNVIGNITSSTITSMQPSGAIDQHNQSEPWRKTFHDNMLALKNLGWYWGPLNYLEAENLVQGRPDGTFLVRDSGHDTYFLSLTFRVLGTTYHTRIEYSQGKFSFWSQPESHSASTIVEFIDKAVAHSVSGKFHYFLQTSVAGQPPMEVSLLYPLSRHQIVQPLKHLARFVILSNIRKDHVTQLDLPPILKNYLVEKQYYIDNIDVFVSLTKNAEPLTYQPSGNQRI